MTVITEMLHFFNVLVVGGSVTVGKRGLGSGEIRTGGCCRTHTLHYHLLLFLLLLL